MGDPEPSVRKERQAPEVVAGEFFRAERFAAGGRNDREAPAEGVGHQQVPVAQEQHFLRLEGEIGDPARSAQIPGNRLRTGQFVHLHPPRPEAGDGQRRVLAGGADRVAAGRDGRFHFEERGRGGRGEGTAGRPASGSGTEDQEFVRAVVDGEHPPPAVGQEHEVGDVPTGRGLSQEGQIAGADDADRSGAVADQERLAGRGSRREDDGLRTARRLGARGGSEAQPDGSGNEAQRGDPASRERSPHVPHCMAGRTAFARRRSGVSGGQMIQNSPERGNQCFSGMLGTSPPGAAKSAGNRSRFGSSAKGSACSVPVGTGWSRSRMPVRTASCRSRRAGSGTATSNAAITG